MRNLKKLTMMCLLAIMLGIHPSAAIASGTSSVKTKIINEIKKGRAEDVYVKSDLTKKDAEAIISQIEKKYYPYWAAKPIVYVEEYHENKYFSGYHIKGFRAKTTYEINKQIDDKAKKIIKKYVKDGMTKKQKITEITKGISNMMSYGTFDRNKVESSTLKLLKKNKGYCEIYSLIFLAACKRIKIPCMIVTGKADGLYGWAGHAWNKIKMGGKWKYVDTCWYDLTGRNNKYLFKNKLWSTHKIKSVSPAFNAG